MIWPSECVVTASINDGEHIAAFACGPRTGSGSLFTEQDQSGRALAGRGADGGSAHRREKQTVPRCFPAPASSRGVHPESSPPEASIGGVSNKKACRSSCVATEANGLWAALVSLPTSSHSSICAGDEGPRIRQLASSVRAFEQGADEQSHRGPKLSASRSANRSGDRAPLR